MGMREYRDALREQWVADSQVSPTRPVSYVPKLSPSTPIPLNAFVGVGVFNKDERDAIGRFQSFGGLNLAVPPEVLDIVVESGIDWRVVRWVKLGTLYTVVCENKRHNGRPST